MFLGGLLLSGCYFDLELGENRARCVGACPDATVDGSIDASLAADTGSDGSPSPDAGIDARRPDASGPDARPPANDSGQDAGCGDTTADPNNCGICGRRCPSGSCVAGECCLRTVCEDPGGADVCVDLMTDPLHCGNCGRDCGGDLCVEGACCRGIQPAVCRVNGRSICVDRDGDPDHCGSCGNRCARGTCEEGRCCEDRCPSGVCSNGQCCASVCNGVCLPSSFDTLELEVGLEPRTAALHDLDGDGRDEVIVPCQLSNDVWIIQWDARVGLRVWNRVSTGRIGPGIDVAEIDDQPGLDLLASIQASGPPLANQLRIFSGTGPATFGPPRALTEPTNPQWLAAYDANRDGLTDIAVRLGTTCMALRLARPGGAYDPAQCFAPTGALSEEPVRAADLDGDGHEELVELRAAAPSWTLWRHSFMPDGSLDRSEPIPVPLGIDPRSFSLPDMNGDGRAELVAHEWQPGRRVALRIDGQDCELAAGAPASPPRFVTDAGDVNGDGVMDLVGFGGCSSCTGTVVVDLGRL